MKKLDKSFYLQDTLTVAKELLGKYLYICMDTTPMIGRIVETEAYIGPDDKACHAYNGRRTSRTEVMYKNGGHAYIYQIYGMYFCLNIVTGDNTAGTGVLIRGLEPIAGMEQMAENRYNKEWDQLSVKEIKNMTNGPGKLCKALNIDKKYNGKDLLGKEIYICEWDKTDKFVISSGKRINIGYAEEYKDVNWRFFIENNSYVSKK